MNEESSSGSPYSDGKRSPKIEFVDVNNLQTSVKPKPVPKTSFKQEDFTQDTSEVSRKPCDNFSWPSLWKNGPRRSAFQPYKPSREAASSSSSFSTTPTTNVSPRPTEPRPASTTALTNLQRGNTQVTAESAQDDTPSWFMMAARGDITPEIIQQAVAAGEDINCRDEDGLSALMWASYHGQIHTVQSLLSWSASVDQEGRWGETALMLAASEGNIEIIRLLMSAGADVNHEDHNHSTALMCAVSGDHPHTVSELLLNQADLWVQNDNGFTAYDIACYQKTHKSKVVLEKFMGSLLTGS